MLQPPMPKKLSWMVLWGLIRPCRTNTQKRCSLHYRGMKCKSRNSRDNWSNRQLWPWNINWSRAKTDRVMPREHTGHSKHPLLTTHKRPLYTWTSPDGKHRNHIDYILRSQRWRNSIQSAKQDWELTVAQIMSSDCKFRLKLKKVGKNH